MSNLGPAWLRKELPQPVARAWHFALQSAPVDAMAAASAVEVALRLVTGLQVASLLAESRQLSGERGAGYAFGQLPEILREKFGRPTLGSWCALLEALRKSARRPFIEALVTWPDQRTSELLRRLVDDRNKLAHAGQLSPGMRRDLEASVAEQSAEVLTSLEWLRRLEIIVVADARPGAGGCSEGHLQLFRSIETHPELERARWRGLPELGRVYVVRAGKLLDVEPFLQRSRLPGAKSEALCLWKGMGQRGDVSLSDDAARLDAWVPIGERARIIPFERVPVALGPLDATRLDAPASMVLEPPTVVAVPGEISPPRRSRAWLWVMALMVLVVIGVIVALVVDSRSPGVATAQPSKIPSVTPTGAVPRTCPAPGLSGAWSFDTYVLRAKPGMEYGLNVRGHYEATFAGVDTDCRVPVALAKMGYTQSGRTNNARFEADVTFAVSASGRSLAGSAQLRQAPTDWVSADIALRVTRWGDYLVGLWRHEGADWKRGGYSGAVLGVKLGQTVPEDLRTSCFFSCVDACGQGADPNDEATEACVLDCARQLADCR